MSGFITDQYRYLHSLKSTDSYATNVEMLLTQSSLTSGSLLSTCVNGPVGSWVVQFPCVQFCV